MIAFGVPLGRLPGDVVIRRGSATFYFPLGTSILVSVVLTVCSRFCAVEKRVGNAEREPGT